MAGGDDARAKAKPKAPAHVAREAKNAIQLRRYVVVLEPPVNTPTEPWDKYFTLMRDHSGAKPIRALPSDLADGFMQIELEKMRPSSYELIHQRGGAVDDVEMVGMDGPPRGHPPPDAPPPKKEAPRKDEPAPPRPDDDVLREGMSHYGLGEPDFVTKDVR